MHCVQESANPCTSACEIVRCRKALRRRYCSRTEQTCLGGMKADCRGGGVDLKMFGWLNRDLMGGHGRGKLGNFGVERRRDSSRTDTREGGREGEEG
eukprot:4114062-Pleurochrysis_carterae.AAC.1